MLHSHLHSFRGRYVIAAFVLVLDLPSLAAAEAAALLTRAALAIVTAGRRVHRALHPARRRGGGGMSRSIAARIGHARRARAEL